MLPLVAVIVSFNLSLRRDAVQHARDVLFRSVSEAVGEQEALVRDLSRLLRGLAARPEVRSPDPAALDGLLTRLRRDRPSVSNIFLCDPAGNVLASAQKPFAGVNYAGHRYFREALTHTGVVAGEYVVGQVTGNAVLHFALAIPGPGGRPRGVAVASLRLRTLRDLFETLPMPSGAHIVELDTTGKLLTSFPGEPDAVRRQGLLQVFDQARNLGRPSGAITSSTADGVDWMCAYTMLHLEGETPYGAIFVGMPVPLALQGAGGRLVVAALASLGSFTLAVILVVVLGRRVLTRRIEVLAGFAASLGEERVCRLPPRFGRDEIGLLGQILADMSRRLHDKSEHLADTMGSLARERDQLARVVARLRETQAELERLASQDPLTGLGNRRCFNERMRLEGSRLSRYGTPFSLIMFDIDDFKRINDTYGHNTGDEVLRRLGALTLAVVRSVDGAYRVGGEEFTVILPETGGEQAMILAERLRRRIAALAVPTAGDGDVHFTVSLGVAEAWTGAAGDKDVFAAADNALYAAKHAGKNRSVLARPQIAA